MYNKKVSLLLGGLALFIFTPLIHAQCAARFDKVEHIFDDFESYHALQQVDAKKELRVSVINDESCQLHMVLTSENQTQLQGQFQSVPYQIKSTQSQLISTSSLRLNFIESSTTLTLLIPSGTPIKSGMYTDRLQMKLYDQGNKLLDEREYNIEESIAPRTSLSVLGYNTFSNTINLGELIPGKEYTMLPSLQVVTNSDIQLSVSSDNNGKLIHSLYKDKYAINYSLDLAGSWLELNNVSKHKFSYSGQTVYLLPLKIQLDDFERQAAGEYSDIIRFQISPLNY
ncbi:hypothetical protein [Pseudoalteromonas sp. SWN166]|uniref:hypothetical protein n=1 Tax=Pseudoalteromonas sp. SWN166 TaxID=2792061 RepID=UPI0018CF1C51|nr:hypothetical protein [Pseudoalteromonas sp. SWN166]MBH0037743.1 hypothetical protein [Pseudoalteromonas sp. SWN166]